MQLVRNIGLAVLAGMFAEALAAAPLLLGARYLDAGQLPLWVEVLEKFQMPGGPAVLRLMQTNAGVRFAARFFHWWVLCAQLLANLIQTTIFALIFLAALYASQFVKRPRQAGQIR